MNNITMEQRKELLNQIVNGEDFKQTVERIVENKLTYYDWLLKNVPEIKLGTYTLSQNYTLDYLCRCMFLDETNENNLVYFIRNEYTGFVKIGKTNNLQRRFWEIENSFNFLGMDKQKLTIEAIAYCPFGINNGKVETYYHNLFKEKRKIGEWFDVSYEELKDTLYVSYIINGVMVVVEDDTDFSNNNTKTVLEEENLEVLKNRVAKELREDMAKTIGIFENWIMPNEKRKGVSSEKLYNYIINSVNKDTNLDNKIKEKIETILDFIS